MEGRGARGRPEIGGGFARFLRGLRGLARLTRRWSPLPRGGGGDFTLLGGPSSRNDCQVIH